VTSAQVAEWFNGTWQAGLTNVTDSAWQQADFVKSLNAGQWEEAAQALRAMSDSAVQEMVHRELLPREVAALRAATDAEKHLPDQLHTAFQTFAAQLLAGEAGIELSHELAGAGARGDADTVGQHMAGWHRTVLQKALGQTDVPDDVITALADGDDAVALQALERALLGLTRQSLGMSPDVADSWDTLQNSQKTTLQRITLGGMAEALGIPPERLEHALAGDLAGLRETDLQTALQKYVTRTGLQVTAEQLQIDPTQLARFLQYPVLQYDRTKIEEGTKDAKAYALKVIGDSLEQAHIDKERVLSRLGNHGLQGGPYRPR
jgi:hypothetical protein